MRQSGSNLLGEGLVEEALSHSKSNSELNILEGDKSILKIDSKTSLDGELHMQHYLNILSQ